MGKKNKDSLGRALIKDRFSKNRHKKHVEDNTMVSTLFTTDFTLYKTSHDSHRIV